MRAFLSARTEIVEVVFCAFAPLSVESSLRSKCKMKRSRVPVSAGSSVGLVFSLIKGMSPRFSPGTTASLLSRSQKIPGFLPSNVLSRLIALVRLSLFLKQSPSLLIMIYRTVLLDART